MGLGMDGSELSGAVPLLGSTKQSRCPRDWEGPCRCAKTKSQFKCPLRQTTGSPSERVIRTAPHTGL